MPPSRTELIRQSSKCPNARSCYQAGGQRREQKRSASVCLRCTMTLTFWLTRSGKRPTSTAASPLHRPILKTEGNSSNSLTLAPEKPRMLKTISHRLDCRSRSIYRRSAGIARAQRTAVAITTPFSSASLFYDISPRSRVPATAVAPTPWSTAGRPMPPSNSTHVMLADGAPSWIARGRAGVDPSRR